MKYITRVCPYCGETIVVEPENMPSDIVMTQGRSKNITTLAHLQCVRQLMKNKLNAEYGKGVTEQIRKGE